MKSLPPDETQKAVRMALVEDLGTGDVTTQAIVPKIAKASAVMVAQEPLTLAGIELAEGTFRELSPEIHWERCLGDGQRAAAGQAGVRVEGGARAILSGERVGL